MDGNTAVLNICSSNEFKKLCGMSALDREGNESMYESFSMEGIVKVVDEGVVKY